MEHLFMVKDQIHSASRAYITDNRDSVVRMNQRTLRALCSFYMAVVVGYLLASFTVFSEWHVTGAYTAAAIIHVFVLTFVLIRYRSSKERSYREVCIACTLFQLYAMTFAGIMSIFPVEMNQPAVYFMPIALAFSVAFVFTFYHTIGLALLEFALYVVASFNLKSQEIFSIDLCSSFLGFVVVIYASWILYAHRARENESRQRMRRSGMMDPLTSTYNKASMEFLSRAYMRDFTQEDCVMMILDFDSFKQVNDTYGHRYGDVVLSEFGRILREVSYKNNIAGRFGGDEFFLLLKKCNLETAEVCAYEVLQKTRALRAPDGTNPFSCSIGIAARRGVGTEMLEEYDALLERADQALYIVKRNGKNNFKIDGELPVI